MAHVIVLGGSFGGLSAAHTLRQALPPSDEVTVVARRDTFFVGFAKLWDLVGARPLARGSARLTDLERHGIRFLHADVTAIDAERLVVDTSAGQLQGDGLVVALGAGFAEPHVRLLAGGSDDAPTSGGPLGHNIYDAEALPAARAALESLESGRLLLSILGGPYLCPPAPYEAVLLLDTWLRDRGRRDHVELLMTTPQPVTLPVAGPDASSFLAAQLGDRGITLLTERGVTAVEAGPTVRLSTGEEISCDVFLGVPAAAPLPLLRDSPLAGPSGWIEPDPATFRTRFERVYAVGDCTRVPTTAGELPKAGVFAAGAAAVAGRNLSADIRGDSGAERATFDGRGLCYLELPGNRAATIRGDFYAQPRPAVVLTPPDVATWEEKLQWEQDRLTGWLGPDRLME